MKVNFILFPKRLAWYCKSTEADSQHQEWNSHSFTVRITNNQQQSGLHPKTWGRKNHTINQFTKLNWTKYNHIIITLRGNTAICTRNSSPKNLIIYPPSVSLCFLLKTKEEILKIFWEPVAIDIHRKNMTEVNSYRLIPTQNLCTQKSPGFQILL